MKRDALADAKSIMAKLVRQPPAPKKSDAAKPKPEKDKTQRKVRKARP